MILRILGSIFFFHILLFADVSNLDESIHENSSEVVKDKNVIIKEEVEVSFGSESMVYMLVLTSLLGSFFLKDELSDFV